MEQLPWFLDRDHLFGLDPTIYTQANYIVLDFETTNLDKGSALNPDNHIVMASWWDSRTGEMRSVYGNEYEQEELALAIDKVEFIVAHNAKFELQWLKRMGVKLEEVLVYCTQIGEVVKYGNVLAKKGLHHQSLEAIARSRGMGGKESTVSKMIKIGICPSIIPKSWLIRYCEVDVELCSRLFEKQVRELEAEGKLGVQFTRCITTPVLADIEFNGVCLDKERVHSEYKTYTKKLTTLDSKLALMTGGINMNSGDQVAAFLYDELGFDEPTDHRGNAIKTGKGKRTTKAEHLDTLKATTKEQRAFLKLRKERNSLFALLSKNLNFFEEVCNRYDGIFYGQYHQTNVQTHRLASTGRRIELDEGKSRGGPQMQNLPNIFKRLFTAREDNWLVGEVDGSQLEFRVGVFLGQDVQGAYDIAHGVDIHTVAAEAVNVLRKAAKRYTFRPMYGGKSGTPKQRKWNKVFAERYYGLNGTQEGWVAHVLKEKHLKLPWGMEFSWPDTKMTRSGYITNSTNIFNYPIQSLATAEMIPVSLVHLWHKIKRSDLRMFIVNTVHDSIIVELPADEREEFVRLSQEAFSDDVYNYLEQVYGLEWNVHLGMGVKTSTHWADGDNKLWDVNGYENPTDDEGEEYKEDFPPPHQLPEAA